ncbi:DsrE family protein [Acidobacteriota bacterium]
MKKVALFAFNGELMCFAHVLLNAIDMQEKGYDVKLIIEGSATKLITELGDSEKPFSNLYAKVKDKGLIDCICKACAGKMGTLKKAEQQAIPFCDEMSGHPSMARYMEAGYTILTF